MVVCMNILILSCGTRNKIVQYFRRAIGNSGIVVATDMQKTAPALYEADKQYIVPRITTDGYIDIILDICKKEKINGVLSLIDPELSLLAKNEDKFRDFGVKVIGSSYELCELSLDKYSMYHWLVEHNYNCAKTFIDFEEFKQKTMEYPVFVKPIRGSASIAIAQAVDERTARFLFEQNENMMIQEFLNGQEIGVDVYIDMISGEVVSIFAKKKLLMKAGETDKAISFKDDKLFSLVVQFVLEAGFRGQVDIDIFDVNGKYYISEVNPRFGGGYPHAYEAGVDHIALILNNLEGCINKKCIGNYDEGLYMMKYNEIMTVRL